VHPNQNPNVLSMISEMQSYPPQRYDSAYANPTAHLNSAAAPRLIPPHPSQHHVNMRPISHQHATAQHWNQHSMMTSVSVNPMDSFVSFPLDYYFHYVDPVSCCLSSRSSPRRGIWWDHRLMIITLDTHKDDASVMIFFLKTLLVPRASYGRLRTQLLILCLERLLRCCSML